MSKTIIEQIAAIDTKIAELTTKRESLVKQQATEAALENLTPGTPVVVRLGRAETLREVKAVVLATADLEAGKRIKVQFGEGFDSEIAVIQPSQIVSVIIEEVSE